MLLIQYTKRLIYTCTVHAAILLNKNYHEANEDWLTQFAYDAITVRFEYTTHYLPTLQMDSYYRKSPATVTGNPVMQR